MKKNILKIMLGSIILEAILVCIFILIGDFDSFAWNALGSVALIFCYSIPCLFYSKIYDNEKYRYIANIGASLACILALVQILLLWKIITAGIFLTQISSSIAILVYLLAAISWILSITTLNKLLENFKNISITLSILLSSFRILSIWNENFLEGFLLRLFYVLIVLTIGSFICTLILKRIYNKELNEIPQQKIELQPNNINNFPQQVNENISNVVQSQQELSNNNNITLNNPSQPANIQSSENISNIVQKQQELPNNEQNNNNIL